MKKKIEVKQESGKEVPVEILATAIADMSKAMKTLSNSRLKRETIVTLIKDKTGYSKAQIEIVLNNLESLEENWLKKR